MLRHLAEPGDSRVAERSVGIEAASNSSGDDREALLLELLKQLLLPRDKRVNLPRLPVQKRGDLLLLLVVLGIGKGKTDERRWVDGRIADASGIGDHLVDESRALQGVAQVTAVNELHRSEHGETRGNNHVVRRLLDCSDRPEVGADS